MSCPQVGSFVKECLEGQGHVARPCLTPGPDGATAWPGRIVVIIVSMQSSTRAYGTQSLSQEESCNCLLGGNRTDIGLQLSSITHPLSKVTAQAIMG